MKTIKIKLKDRDCEVIKSIAGQKTGAAAVRWAVEVVIKGDVAVTSLKRHGLACETKQSDNPMKSRLEDVRSGKHSTTAEILSLAEE